MALTSIVSEAATGWHGAWPAAFGRHSSTCVWPCRESSSVDHHVLWRGGRGRLDETQDDRKGA